ncbi:hypothetical protein BLNAU_20775 [Blattamonas nauphoetae]|uniref:Uncharacterized protein n=1 Tax=Blattamonas nauphoetae TaxID=2049346 RepID=A0ABQ9WXU0_9EUKA|nr:hypothetical protein BLNAU_20775 [Blattamonas nauphoetae]
MFIITQLRVHTYHFVVTSHQQVLFLLQLGTGMDASSQLQLRHAKVAKAGFLFTKSRALSLSTHSSDEALHVERVQLYCQPHGQKILDEADGTTASLPHDLDSGGSRPIYSDVEKCVYYKFVELGSSCGWLFFRISRFVQL